MAFKRYFTLIVFVAFGILSLAAKREWKADDVPIPFLRILRNMFPILMAMWIRRRKILPISICRS